MCYLFLIPHVKRLVNDGFTVDIACSAAKEFSDQNYEKEIKSKIPPGCNYFSISSSRSPLSLSNVKAYQELKFILKREKYDLVWTNEPVMGVITRLASLTFRRSDLKVLYLVHGLHFFKGGPILNWFFFPVELIVSLFTDLTVTINKLDTQFVSSFLFSPVKYIKGIGFEHGKFNSINTSIDYKSLRSSFGFSPRDVVLIAVGELMPRKNHIVAIKALSKIANSNVKLLICGVGPLNDELNNLVKDLNLSQRVVFAGLRNDIASMLKISDVFIHPSVREGLGIAPLEAMASGLPIITSNAQGITDYSIDNVTGFVCDPNDEDCFTKSIDKLLQSEELRKKIGSNNIKHSREFDISQSTNSMSKIIDSLIN